MAKGITFHTRKWVRPEDLNANGTLFGGSLLRWIDEEAAIYSIIQLGNKHVVTKFMSEINFIASAKEGDLIEMGLTAIDFGRTSITLRAEVRNIFTQESILTIEAGVREHGLGRQARTPRLRPDHLHPRSYPAGNHQGSHLGFRTIPAAISRLLVHESAVASALHQRRGRGVFHCPNCRPGTG